MKERREITVEVPKDCRLIGVRTDGDVAIIVYEPIQKNNTVGFLYNTEDGEEYATQSK